MDTRTMLEETREQRNQRWASMSITELAAEYKMIKEKLAKAEEYKTAMQSIHDHMGKQTLPERMEEEGIETLKIKDVNKKKKKADIYCSCPKDNQQALSDWLVEHGYGSMIKPTINSSTLKAFVKEQMKDGGEYPQDLLSITPYELASIVKA